MIRVRDDRWVAKDKIDTCFINNDELRIKVGLAIYIVKEQYIEEVCAALNLPLPTILKELKCEGNIGREEPKKA